MQHEWTSWQVPWNVISLRQVYAVEPAFHVCPFKGFLLSMICFRYLKLIILALYFYHFLSLMLKFIWEETINGMLCDIYCRLYFHCFVLKLYSKARVEYIVYTELYFVLIGLIFCNVGDILWIWQEEIPAWSPWCMYQKGWKRVWIARTKERI